jgi:hypothetical protein
MRSKTLKVFVALSMVSFTNCSQELKEEELVKNNNSEATNCAKTEVSCSKNTQKTK